MSKPPRGRGGGVQTLGDLSKITGFLRYLSPMLQPQSRGQPATLTMLLPHTSANELATIIKKIKADDEMRRAAPTLRQEVAADVSNIDHFGGILMVFGV